MTYARFVFRGLQVVVPTLFGLALLFSGTGFPVFSLFVGTSAFADESQDGTYNSQTIALHRGTLSPFDPADVLGGGDVTVIAGALLSESGPAGTLADIESDRTKGTISVYVVREGDTLSQIADMFGVSTNTIRWANDINKDTAIQPGDTLVILPITGVQHAVAKGDTLKSIAKEYEADVSEIANYNGLAADAALAVGDTVVVPHGEVEAPAPAPSTSRSRITTSGGPEYAGYYLRPIRGGTKSQHIHGYNGVDLATYAGAEIYAAAAGEVIISRSGGWNGGYGNYIVIRHDNGTQTLYAHNAQNIVSVGQSVIQGQVIGYVGSTGRSTGHHVHFEVRGAKNPF